MTPIIVVSPSHRLSASLAIAANRAGETGLLDLGYSVDADQFIREMASLRQHVRSPQWGIRVNGLYDMIPWDLIRAGIGDTKVPIISLAVSRNNLADRDLLFDQARQLAESVLVEVTDLEQAAWAQGKLADGIIVRGIEAGGEVSQKTTFCLLQLLSNQCSIPFWVQGGIGPDTAAAALLAGARGIVLAEQLWLADESPLDREEKSALASLKQVDTTLISDGQFTFRTLTPADRQTLDQLSTSASDPAAFHRKVASLISEGLIVPAGQDVSLAARLARRHHHVAGIIKAYRLRSEENFKMACRAESLAPESPLADSLGIKFPIVQGPMAGITDQPAFAYTVASAGALPMIALGSLGVDESRALLQQTKAKLGSLPWGAAVSMHTAVELRQRQIDLILSINPTVALLDGRHADRADDLNKTDIITFWHVDSLEMLESLLAQGARHFVVEGNESGGPLGPRSSFSLWQCAIDALLETKLVKPDEVHVVFGGPIHDSLSSAMTAAAAAPLASRGMRIGVQLGSAYFFTPESVETGIITPTYHEAILQGKLIAHLHTGAETTIRCIPSPFVDEFAAFRAELMQGSLSSQKIQEELTSLSAERLRLAARGDWEGSQASVETIARRGLFRVGDLAVLRHEAVSMPQLHEEVSPASVLLLSQLANTQLPWQPILRPARPKSEDIAIVGMACMFPKADDLRTYWENICNSVNAVEEVPADRWDAETYFDKDRLARDRVYSKWGGFIGNIIFDPMKWRIPPAALKAIEPLQILSLEVAARAMADAGYDKRDFPRERTGVLFACAGSHEMGSAYAFRTMMRHYLPQVKSLTQEAREALEEELHEILPEWTEDSFPGFLMNVVAGRIAREMNVNGPNYTVDAACAAALAAFHAAIEQLRSGTSDMVIVGGADATNNPMCYMSFSKTHALSPQGRSRPFDESGDGIGLGEGIGVCILKRLRDAERDGDKIYAVIKGIGSSSDGKNKSLTAPYPPGQIKAVERAYADAEIEPTSVSLIEAHGTGTVVGDSAEITTLSEVFGSRTDAKRFAAVGSVKSMIGHTKTVAGMASIIKTALALKHRVLPPTIGVDKPTSRFDFHQSPFYVNTQTRPWIEDMGSHPRRAGVSAFGFGGTNFHVVLEEYTGNYLADADINFSPRSAELLTIARSSREVILARLAELKEALAGRSVAEWTGLASSIAHEEKSRSATSSFCRLAIVASSTEDFTKKIERALTLLTNKNELVDPTGIFYSEAPPVSEKEVCFLYPGQGSQYVNMMKDVLVGSPDLQDIVSSANNALADFLPDPLSRYIFPPPTFTEEEQQQAFRSLSNTRVAQPALGVMELVATDLLAKFGLKPGMVAGHSYGEHVALYAAGVLDRDELLWLSAMRGQVCAEIASSSPGGMAAVQANAQTTQNLIDEAGLTVYLANMNAPDQTIIAAAEAQIDQAVDMITAKGIRAKRIPVSAPFHTPLLEAGSHAMAEHFAKATFQQPTLPVYSNTTGRRHSDHADEIRDLLTRHFSEPVHFEEEIRQIYADGARVFIEAGPGKVLTELTQRILKDQPIATVAIDVPGRDGWTQLGHALGRSFVLGLPVRSEEWFSQRDLGTLSITEFLADYERRTVPKKSDWILGAAKAEPAFPSAKSKPVPVSSRIIGLVGRDIDTGTNGSAVESKIVAGAPSASAVAAPPAPTFERAAESIPAGRENESRTPVSTVSALAGPAWGSSPLSSPMPISTPLAKVAPASELPASSVAVTLANQTPLGGVFVSGNGRSEGSRTFRHSLSRPLSRSLKHQPRLQTRPSMRTQVRKPQAMTPYSTSSHDTNGTTQGVPPIGGGVDLFMELQASTRMFIEFQQTQQVLMERFLDTQERLLTMCLGKGPVPVSAPTHQLSIAPHYQAAPAPPPLAPAPYVNGHAAPLVAHTPAPPVAPPAPVAPVAPAATAARGPITMPGAKAPVPTSNAYMPAASRPAPSAPAPVAAAPVASAPVASAPAPMAAPAPVAKAPAPTPAASANGAPPVEDFRKDLLAVISERTGYPEDMLDEELPLEAGLGIDSIKTVEIFSTLKKYHPFMRDEDRDEEETLAEFTKLKTIKDIIDSYANRLVRMNGAAPASNGTNGSVERHVLTTASAPAGEASKKNSLAST
ncbi:acyltransferase domain-containing protein [bacterium]|nr:acyltransferase domain-containing protein [bacterium]